MRVPDPSRAPEGNLGGVTWAAPSAVEGSSLWSANDAGGFGTMVRVRMRDIDLSRRRARVEVQVGCGDIQPISGQSYESHDRSKRESRAALPLERML
jgi:hypothetical protein